MKRKYTAPPNIPNNDDLSALALLLLQELQAIGITTQELAEQQVETTYRAPAKPRSGMIVLADGTKWNPGSGRGYYGYDSVTGTWRFLG